MSDCILVVTETVDEITMTVTETSALTAGQIALLPTAAEKSAFSNIPTADEKASFPATASSAEPLILASAAAGLITTHNADTAHSHLTADQLAALPTGISATNPLLAEDSNSDRLIDEADEAEDYALMYKHPTSGWMSGNLAAMMLDYAPYLAAQTGANVPPIAGDQIFFMQNTGMGQFCIYDYFLLPPTTAQSALNANIPSAAEKAAIASLAPLASYDIYPTGTAQVDGMPYCWTAQGGSWYCDIEHGRSPYVIDGDVTSGKRNQPFDIQAWTVTDNEDPALIAFTPVMLPPAEFTVADTVKVWSDNNVRTHIRTGF